MASTNTKQKLKWKPPIKAMDKGGFFTVTSGGIFSQLVADGQADRLLMNQDWRRFHEFPEEEYYMNHDEYVLWRNKRFSIISVEAFECYGYASKHVLKYLKRFPFTSECTRFQKLVRRHKKIEKRLKKKHSPHGANIIFKYYYDVKHHLIDENIVSTDFAVMHSSILDEPE